MRSVTISGGADGRTVTVSGGNGTSQATTYPKAIIVETYAYPNVTVQTDPVLAADVLDLKTWRESGIINGGIIM